MAYDLPDSPSERDLLAKDNRIKLRNFKLSAVGQPLEIRPLSILPWVTAQKTPVIYEKKNFKLPISNHSIDIIKKNNKFHSFVWHTSPDNVRLAVRYGFVKCQSITGQVISALGEYHLIVQSRLKRKIISNRYSDKIALLENYQKRFEALQPLEMLVNRTDYTEAEFKKIFQEYYDQLTDEQDRKQADNFLRDFNFSEAMRATGINSILTFVKKVMLTDLNRMQNQNQDLTYSRQRRFAATRGDLGSYITNAVKAIRDYNAPPHDAIYPEHHGDYRQHSDEIAFDSDFHCDSLSQAQRALLAVTFVEGLNDVELLRKLPEVQEVSAPKWQMNGGINIAFKKAAAWLANLSIKFAAGFIEVPLTVVVEPLLFGRGHAFFVGMRKLATYEIKIDAKTPFKGQDILQEAEIITESLGKRIRHFALVAFKNTFQDLVYGTRDIYKKFTIHLFDDIYDDYNAGKPTQVDLSKTIEACKAEFKIIDQHKQGIWRNYAKGESLTKEIHGKFATPSFLPSAGEFNDALNAGADGLDTFMEFFLHNIHRKHPFAGLLFTVVYVAGGLAVLAPQYVAFLGAQYLAYSQAMGYSMSKGAFTAAVSSGVTQAQLAASTYEMVIHGHKSWWAKAAVELEKDPFTSLIYTSTAVGLGYLFVYQFNISWLKDDMGTFPPTSLGFIAFKFGVLVHELLAEHGHVHLEDHEALKELRAYLTELYRTKFKDATDETVASEVEKALQQLLQADNLTKLHSQVETLKLNNEKTFNYFSGLSEEELNKIIQRNQGIQFLMNNKENLKYLSAQAKHQLVQQFKPFFSTEEIRALKQELYPEEPASILRTTLSIIIAYPAFLIRMGAALGSSLWHFNSYPLQDAGTDFGYKILKDLVRVGRAASKVFKTTCGFFQCHLKVLGDVLMNSIFARSEAILTGTSHIAHANYTASAAFDAMYETFRQLFSTPVDAGIKKVTPANAVGMERQIGRTYCHLLQSLGAQEASQEKVLEEVVFAPVLPVVQDKVPTAIPLEVQEKTPDYQTATVRI